MQSKGWELFSGTLTSGDPADAHTNITQQNENIHGLRMRLDLICNTADDVIPVAIAVFCLEEGVATADLVMSATTIQDRELQASIWGLWYIMVQSKTPTIIEFNPQTSRTCLPEQTFGIKLVRDTPLTGTGQVQYIGCMNWWETIL